MLSDSISESIQTKDDLALTKLKRDQFLVKIRKTKNQNKINEKRKKFAHNDIIIESNPFLRPTSLNKDSNVIVPEETAFDLNSTEEYSSQLNTAYGKFYETLRNQEWEEFIIVLQALRQAMGSPDSLVTGKTVIEMGIVSNVLSLLSEQFSKISHLQSEAAWLIANISAGEATDNAYLVEQNCVPILCDCIRSSNEDLQESAVWALANIASEKAFDFKTLMLDASVLKEVVKQLNKTSQRPSFYRTGMWLISKLLQEPYPLYDKVSISITSLGQLIGYPDEETQKLVMSSLMHFSSLDDYSRFHVIRSQQLIPKIVKMIEHKNQQISFSALKTVGNLATGDKELCQSGILDTLAVMLTHQEEAIRKETCYALSNILSEDVRDYNSVIHSKVVPGLVEVLSRDTDQIKYEVTICILSILNDCSANEIELLVKQCIVEILVQNLRENHLKLVQETLKTLIEILKYAEHQKPMYAGLNPIACKVAHGNGIYLVETLTQHMNKEISSLASLLLDSFFGKETELP